MEEAAAELASLGPGAVLLKGGHLGGDRSPDVLWQTRAGSSGWTGPASGRPPHPRDRMHALGGHLRPAGARRGPAAWRAAGPRNSSPRAIAAGVDVGAGFGPVNPGWCARSRRTRPGSGPRWAGQPEPATQGNPVGGPRLG